MSFDAVDIRKLCHFVLDTDAHATTPSEICEGFNILHGLTDEELNRAANLCDVEWGRALFRDEEDAAEAYHLIGLQCRYIAACRRKEQKAQTPSKQELTSY